MLATLLVLAAAAPAARAGSYVPGGSTPAACAGPLFADAVGTPSADVLLPRALPLPQRLYGLTGPDRLTGADALATCLFGGQGEDLLVLGAAGGVALGEVGRDVLVGSSATDALSGGDGGDTLAGLAGPDVLRGGRAVDAYSAGAGDDVLDAHDGRREVVDCGAGEDAVQADGFDALLGCEQVRTAGPGLPARAAHGGRIHFTAPHAGEYRVLGACGAMGGATLIARGRRASIRLSAPCARSGYLVHAPAPNAPAEPLLRVTKLAP